MRAHIKKIKYHHIILNVLFYSVNHAIFTLSMCHFTLSITLFLLCPCVILLCQSRYFYSVNVSFYSVNHGIFTLSMCHFTLSITLQYFYSVNVLFNFFNCVFLFFLHRVFSSSYCFPPSIAVLVLLSNFHFN